MLTPEQIVEQGKRFACCSFDHLVKSMRADITGEVACAQREWSQSLKAYWAATVMGSTVLEGGCHSIAYATEVAAIVGCLCKTSYGCNCSEDDPATSCAIVADAVAVYVPCGTPVDAWIFSGAGESGMNDLVFLPSAYIPEAEPGSQVYAAGVYTLYELIGGTYAVDETIGVHLYTAPTLGGTWSVDTGASPAPTQAQAVLGDLCDTSLDPEARIAMAVADPDQESIYAMDCCGEMEFFDYTDALGFDYVLDFGLN